MKRILVLTLLVMTMACSNSDDKKHTDPGPGGGGGGTAGEVVDTTNYDECNRGTPTNDIRGSWYNTKTSNGISLHVEFYFSNDSVRVTNFCSRNELSTQASVSLFADITPTSFSIRIPGSDSQTVEAGGTKLTCTVDVPKLTAQYKFNGSCLVVTDDATKATFTLLRSR